MRRLSIPGFRRYELGADGLVYCLNGRHLKNAPVKFHTDDDGYLVGWMYADRGFKGPTKHALIVCLAHHGPRPAGHRICVRHLNGSPGDDRPENLAWGTPQDNTDDAKRYSRNRFLRSKLSVADVEAIRKAIAAGASGRATAALFGVSPATVSRIRTGSRWWWTNGGARPLGVGS